MAIKGINRVNSRRKPCRRGRVAKKIKETREKKHQITNHYPKGAKITQSILD
jgi:hypothetical protein